MAVGVIELEVRPDLSKFRGQMTSEAQGAGGAAGEGAGHNFMGGFLNIAKGAAVAGGAAIVAGLGIGAKIAGDLEQSQIAFETLFQSADKAKAFLGDLKTFAAATPFDLPGLTTAAQKLASAGIEADKILPIMETLGDSIAAMGGGSEQIDRATLALQQMALKGKVSGEEMLQLAEAGVPAWDALASKMGVDVATAQKQVSDGLVDYTTLYDALGEKSGSALQRSQGAMEKQAQSFQGLMSTLKDTLQIGLADAVGPALQALKPLMADGGALMQIFQSIGQILAPIGTLLVGVFQAALPSIQAITTALVGIVNAIAPILTQMAQAAGPVIGQLIGAIGGVLVQLAPILGDVMAALQPLILALGSGLADVITTLAPSFLNLVKAASPLIDAIVHPLVKLIPLLTPIISLLGASLASALTTLAPTLIRVVEVIGEMALALAPLVAQLGGLLGDALQKIAPLFVKLIDAALPLIDAIFFPLVNIVIPALLPVLGQLVDALLPVIDALIGVIAQVAPILVPVMLKLAEVFVQQATAMVPLLPLLSELLMSIVPLIPPLLQIVEALLPPFIFLLGLSTAYIPPLVTVLGWLINILTDVIDVLVKVIDWIANLVSWIGNNLFQTLGKLVEFGGRVVSSIWDGISGALGGFASNVASIATTVTNAISGMWSKMYRVGSDIINGLWAGISGAAGWLADKVKGLADKILGPFKKVLDIFSPSGVMAREIGVPMMQGIAQGFNDAAPGAIAAMSKDVASLGSLLPSSAGSLGMMGAGSGGAPLINVYIGDQELTDIVRSEVRRSNDRLALALSGRVG